MFGGFSQLWNKKITYNYSYIIAEKGRSLRWLGGVSLATISETLDLAMKNSQAKGGLLIEINVGPYRGKP